MSVPFKIVYLVKDGETGENLIQFDDSDIISINGTKILDNSIPSAKLNIIDGEKIADNSIPINKIINNTSAIYQIDNIPPENLKKGMPVYWAGTNYQPANANIPNKTPTAIIKEIQSDKYFVQFSGSFSMANSDWDILTEETGGLSTVENENVYYLSNANDGGITNLSPIFSVPVYNCLKNDGVNSTVEVKFGILTAGLTNNSFSQEREVFIGDNIENTFILTKTPYSRNSTMVTVNGMVLQNESFIVQDKDIILSNIPEDQVVIEITYLTQNNFNYANIIKHTEILTINKNNFLLPIAPKSENEIMAWIGGSYQDSTNFVLNGNVITFDTIIDKGTKVQFLIFDSVQFSDLSAIKRKTLSINNNMKKTLVDAFGMQTSARYDFHVISNPLIGGTIRLQETDPLNIRVETFSTSITVNMDTNGKINIYINNEGKLEFQNLLGQAIILMLERHT